MELQTFKAFSSPIEKKEYARAIIGYWMHKPIYDHPCADAQASIALAYAIADLDEKENRCVHTVEAHQYFVRVIFNEPWTLGLPCVVIDKTQKGCSRPSSSTGVDFTR